MGIKLAVNPNTLAFALNAIPASPEMVSYFADQLRDTNTDVSLYQNTPPPESTPEQVQAAAVDKNGVWARMVHPYVLAQITIALAERAGLPCPDNLFVWLPDPDPNKQWQPLHMIEGVPQHAPVAPLQPAAPVAQPVGQIHQTMEQAFSQPIPVTNQATPPQPTIHLAPDNEILDAEFSAPPVDSGGSVTQTVLGAPVTMDAATAQQIDQVRQNREAMHHQALQGSQEPAQPPSNVVPLHQQPPAQAAAPAPGQQPSAPTDNPSLFGLPSVSLLTTAGQANAFAKDPLFNAPKSPLPRLAQDVLDLVPTIFSLSPGDAVGSGKGSTQRRRAYLAAAFLVHQALASVPDESVSVGYLKFHLLHKLHGVKSSPTGPTGQAVVDYVFAKVDDGKDE